MSFHHADGITPVPVPFLGGLGRPAALNLPLRAEGLLDLLVFHFLFLPVFPPSKGPKPHKINLVGLH